MVLPAVLAGLACLCFWGLVRALRFKRLVENVPTSKVKGVFVGLTEVKGRAESEAPFTSFLAGKPTVWYRFEVEEEWERTVTDTDSEGKTTTRTESGHDTVASGGEGAPFFLRDDTGALRIDPDGADIDATCLFSETCGRSDPLYFAKGPRTSIANSTHRRRFTEHGIAVGQSLYVLGPAALRDDAVEAEIRKGRRDEPFLISHRDEKRIVAGRGWAAFFCLLFAALLVLAAPLVHAEARGSTFGQRLSLQAGAMGAAGGILAFALGAAWAWLLRNDLVRVRNRLRNALSLIDVQLQRRADLIPGLAKVVETAAHHERSVQERLAGLRAVAHRRNAPAPVLGREIGESREAAREIVAVAERYPELKADAAFRKLFDALRDTEDRIALARAYHNDCVAALRNRLHTFPDNLIALLTGFRAGRELPE